MKIMDFGIEVSNYQVQGDQNDFDNHVFTITVWVAQDNYDIQRSYAMFCDLDSRLRRKYPKSNLPENPLSGSEIGVGGRTKDANTFRMSVSVSFSKKLDTTEIISRKKGPLTTYLLDLFKIPEILRSSELINFFDCSSEDGDKIEEIKNSIVDFMLEDDKYEKKSVLKKLLLEYEVQKTNFIVWSFYTKNKDIGFSINLDQRRIVNYERHNSHIEKVTGIMEIPENGKAIVNWDNSYSRVTSKQLRYIIKIISSEDYSRYSTEYHETLNMLQVAETRRNTLRRIFFSKSSEILAENGLQQPNLDVLGHNDNMIQAELESEIKKLQNEKNSLQMALSSSESTLNEMNNRLIQQTDLNSNINALKNELVMLKEELSEEKQARDQDQATIARLQQEVQMNKDKMLELSRQTRRDSKIQSTSQQQLEMFAVEMENLKVENNSLKETKTSLDSMLQRLKGEKKQLKTYALELKKQIEDLNSEEGKEKREIQHMHVVNLLKELTPLAEELSSNIMNMTNTYAEISAIQHTLCVENNCRSSVADICKKSENAVMEIQLNRDRTKALLAFASSKGICDAPVADQQVQKTLLESKKSDDSVLSMSSTPSSFAPNGVERHGSMEDTTLFKKANQTLSEPASPTKLVDGTASTKSFLTSLKDAMFDDENDK